MANFHEFGSTMLKVKEQNYQKGPAGCELAGPFHILRLLPQVLPPVAYTHSVSFVLGILWAYSSAMATDLCPIRSLITGSGVFTANFHIAKV